MKKYLALSLILLIGIPYAYAEPEFEYVFKRFTAQPHICSNEVEFVPAFRGITLWTHWFKHNMNLTIPYDLEYKDGCNIIIAYSNLNLPTLGTAACASNNVCIIGLNEYLRDKPEVLREVIAHEIGHAMGLGHIGSADQFENSIMYPHYHPDIEMYIEPRIEMAMYCMYMYGWNGTKTCA